MISSGGILLRQLFRVAFFVFLACFSAGGVLWAAEGAGINPVKEYYDTGELKSVAQYQNGQKSGPALLYYPNGKIKEKLNYKDGKLEGTAVQYYENGQLSQEAHFTDGKFDGVGKIYTPEGKLQEELVLKGGKVVSRSSGTASEAATVETTALRRPPEQARRAASNGISAFYLRPPSLRKETQLAKNETPVPKSEKEKVQPKAATERPKEKKINKEVKIEQDSDLERKIGGFVFEMGYERSHIIYREPNILISDEGDMQGVTGSVTHRLTGSIWGGAGHMPWLNMYKLDLRYSWGKVDYDGALSNGTPATTENITDFMIESRLLAGHDFKEFDPLLLTLYTGFGYRYLNDDSSFTAAGYERESQYMYMPVGVNLTKSLNLDWSLGANLEYDIFLAGWQTSHLSNVNPGYNDITNEQTDGFGVRGSLRLQKIGERFDFILEPFYRYWDIEDSDTVALTLGGVPTGLGGQEPKNNSNEYGIKFIARF